MENKWIFINKLRYKKPIIKTLESDYMFFLYIRTKNMFALEVVTFLYNTNLTNSTVDPFNIIFRIMYVKFLNYWTLVHIFWQLTFNYILTLYYLSE